jgi:uncharacterized protein
VQIPESLTNFRCYGPDASEFLGVTDAELPSFDTMTETISGAGIAGEYASPVPGHFGSQMVKVKFRAPTEKAMALMAPVRQVLQFYGAMKLQDPMLGQLISKQIYVYCAGQVKNYNVGKLEAGKPMGAELDLEIAKIVIKIGGVEAIELDKFNMIYKVFGVDHLRQTRIDMGGV